MSAPDLLVVIDPAARQADGESVRITRDVLCAGAPETKVCLPEDREEAARALSRRGDRRPVVVGDDRALLRTVRQLHQERGLANTALSAVPVGTPANTTLLRALGIPDGPVAASRTALSGPEQSRDLLVDDSGGVVLGALHVPAWPSPYDKPGRGATEGPAPRRGDAAASGADGTGRATDAGGAVPGGTPEDDGCAGRPGAERSHGRTAGPGPRPEPRPAERPTGGADEQRPEERPDGSGGHATRPVRTPPRRGARSLFRTLAHPRPLLTALTKPSGPAAWWGRTPEWDQRLRVEADGAVLADLDRPVTQVSLAPGHDGLAEVVVRERAGEPVRARARTVTVSGADFHYRADALVAGPVRSRTWTALEGACRLTLPAAPEGT